MADHIWSVLCYKGCIDRDSNQVSLLDIMEGIKIHGPIQRDPNDLDKTTAFSIKMDLVSLWTRSNRSKPELAIARYILLSPEGQEISTWEIKVNLEQQLENFRTLIKFNSFPFCGAGQYYFIVKYKSDGVKGKWKTAAKIPLQVSLVEEPPSGLPPS